MRIIGGRLKGRSLKAPTDYSVRPTSDRLRETLFNILMHAYEDPVTDARVLDLFAGTGALGLEALSRGARFAQFVDDSAQGAACYAPILKALAWRHKQKFSVAMQPAWDRCIRMIRLV